MKKLLLIILALGLIAFLGYWGTEIYLFADGVKKDVVRLENSKLEQKIQDGDIIFQTSMSSQSKAIQLATKSKYSHMGIIYENDGQFFVYEAVQPVKLTPLTEWVNRCENGHYVIKRLENADQVLSNPTLTKMKQNLVLINWKRLLSKRSFLHNKPLHLEICHYL